MPGELGEKTSIAGINVLLLLKMRKGREGEGSESVCRFGKKRKRKGKLSEVEAEGCWEVPENGRNTLYKYK